MKHFVITKLNKCICVVCAVAIALTTFIYNAASVRAEETELDFIVCEPDDVLQALIDAGLFSLELGVDSLEMAVGLAGWVWDAATCTFTDEAAGIMYGLLEDGTLGRCRSGSSGGGGRVRVDTAADVEISGKTFSEICKQLEEQYAPSLGTKYISWKNNCKYIKGYPALTLYYDGNICGFTPDEAPDGVYLLPFFRVGDDYYYRFEQLHLYQQLNDDYTITLFYGALNNTEGSEVYRTYSLNGSLSQYRYVSINLRLDNYFPSFKSLENYIVGTTPDYNLQFVSGTAANTNAIVSSESFLFGKYFLSTDVTQYIDLASKDSHGSYTHMAYNAPTDENDFDWGYFVSTEPHTPADGRIPIINPDNIDPNSIVKPTGDTIYNYTITNDSGDSTTINYYITNNYIIPETDDGEGESGDTTINNNWDVSFGDFLVNIGTTIETSITNTVNYLFVPSDGFFEDVEYEFNTQLQDKLPVIADCDELFNSLMVEISEDNKLYGYVLPQDEEEISSGEDEQEKVEILYPKWEFNIDFFGKKMSLTVLDFGMFAEVLPKVRLVVLVFVYAVFIWRFIRFLPVLIGNVADIGAAGVSANDNYNKAIAKASKESEDDD